MPTLYNKTCLHCKKFFTVIPRKKKQKYCSQICVRTDRKNPDRLSNCAVCQTPLTKDTQVKFCSTNCSSIISNQKRTLESRRQQRITLKQTLSNKGLSRTDEKEIYFSECNFKKWSLKVWKKIPGFELLKKHGMWHPIKNPNGVVRDHILSKYYGWVNKIDPKYISHPANCRIITNLENVKKGTKVEIDFDILLENIKKFDEFSYP